MPAPIALSTDARSVTLALSGGVGGAKLAAGLAAVLAPQHLAIVCNTGDDFEHLGLPICPDLDTVMYTLGGRSNAAQGWGLADESWRVIGALGELGGDTWFRLGDLDIATHLYRLSRQRAGASLTTITDELCGRYGVRHAVWPMADAPVRTMVQVAGGPLKGELPFQHYFVRERCQPPVGGFRFAGIDAAAPQARMLELLDRGAVGAIVICPSNPFVSVDPILHLPGLHSRLKAAGAPIVAVSPIVGGRALKGPAAKMMEELGMPVTSRAVAEYYGDLLDGFVIDTADAADARAIEALGPKVCVTPSVMNGPQERRALAAAVLDFARSLAG
jgi:LPPG:FO 2-phospho-L-lactate transferase